MSEDKYGLALRWGQRGVDLAERAEAVDMGDVVLALVNDSKLRMDAVGVGIDETKLWTWPRLKAARREFFGDGWLSRLYCRRIRPWVNPAKHSMAQTELEEAVLEHRVAFDDYVLSQLEEKLAAAEED